MTRELHVQLTLKSLPGEPLEVRRQLIAAIESEVAKVGDTGAGGGVMDIWLYAEDAPVAVTSIRRIAERLGISPWTQIAVRAFRVKVEIRCDKSYSTKHANAALEKLVREIEADLHDGQT